MADPELAFERRMSDAEALMWTVEKDPWLSSTFGVVSVLERPLDLDLFRARMRVAVARVARLRERVVPTGGRLGAPTWQPDPEFDLDHHVRPIALPSPGTDRQLLDLATHLVADPFDRTRPLWQFWVIEGLEGGRGALLSKLHHTITDGEGGVRLAEAYMDFTADAPMIETVDLDAVVAEAIAHERAANPPLAAAAARGAADDLRRRLGRLRGALGGLALNVADPARVPEIGAEAIEHLRSLLAQLAPAGDDRAGSPIWTARSRRRHLEVLSVGLGELKAAAARAGSSLNDAFLTGVGAGVARYHEELGAESEGFRATFAVSTRQGNTAGGNAFAPLRVRLPGTGTPIDQRLGLTTAAVREVRSDPSTTGLLTSVTSLANLLPTGVVTRLARMEAARVDVATSNVRAAPVPTWVGGSLVEANYALGPVVGTPCNVTLLSYCDRVDLGLHIDPTAIAEPARLRRCMEEGFAELIE
jgi:WS/DGAT/MGAT family acyltransferase